MIKKFSILGERCSGTNFLENAMIENFDIGLTWEYGYKHFFGFNQFIDSDDVLFIGIIRDPYAWINSLYLQKYHLSMELRTSVFNYLNKPFWSWLDTKESKKNGQYGNEIMHDRHIYTNERYKNIYDCRKTKLKYLIDDMPNKVKNYILIKYEDLRDDFSSTLELIRQKGNLQIKSDIEYPVKVTYTHNKKLQFAGNAREVLQRDEVLSHKCFDTYYEKQLGYVT